jgi:hypothetical protein
MFEPIVIRFNRRGPSNQAEVVVAAEQQAAILAEFRNTPDWLHFVAYCDWSLGARGRDLDLKAGTFVDLFEQTLEEIIGRRVECNAFVFWAVLDALRNEHLTTRH